MEVEFLVGNRWQRPDIFVKVDHQLGMAIIMMRMVLTVMMVLLVMMMIRRKRMSITSSCK